MSGWSRPLRRRHDRDLDSAIEANGYAVLRRIIPASAVEAALRELHLALVRKGLPAETLDDWRRRADWFPYRKWHPAITNLAAHLPTALREGEMCDPQIVLHPPDDCDDLPLTPHLDEEPNWADGRRYLRLVGIALSPAHRGNGALHVWPYRSSEPEPVELDPGDVVVMHPELPHTSGLNRSGSIRYAVYFRFLTSLGSSSFA